jgi:hypothetical protein
LRVLPLALIAALLAVPSAVLAQSAAQQMLDSATKLRANVEKLKATLPPDVQAQMLKQAAEIEKQVAAGVYGKLDAPAPVSTDLDKNVAERLMREHGRLDWLTTKAACAGYTLENYSTFRYSPAINDRDSHCRNAYGHYATYLRVTRAGEDKQFGEQALFYYDAAAKRAVGLVGR